MQRLANVLRQPLRWSQPDKRERIYVLHASSRRMATITFRSASGSFAVGHNADGSWSFERVGLQQTAFTIRAEGGPGELALFEFHGRNAGGTLRLTGGRSLIVATGHWPSQIEFQSAEQHPLVRCRMQGVRRAIAELEVLPALEGMREKPWLLLFAGYLVVMMHEDAKAAVTTAAGHPSDLPADGRQRWWSGIAPTHTSRAPIAREAGNGADALEDVRRLPAEAVVRQVACAEEEEPGEPLTSAAGVRRSAEALHARS